MKKQKFEVGSSVRIVFNEDPHLSKFYSKFRDKVGLIVGIDHTTNEFQVHIPDISDTIFLTGDLLEPKI